MLHNELTPVLSAGSMGKFNSCSSRWKYSKDGGTNLLEFALKQLIVSSQYIGENKSDYSRPTSFRTRIGKYDSLRMSFELIHNRFKQTVLDLARILGFNQIAHNHLDPAIAVGP